MKINNLLKNCLIFLLLSILLFFINCEKDSTKMIDIQTDSNPVKINQLIKSGDFSTARKLILNLRGSKNTSPQTLIDLRFKYDLMNRIERDFNRSEAYVKKRLKKYYPNLTDDMVRKWEKDNDLEMRIIDGKRRYFRNAVPNLFRINADAKAIKEKVDGIKKDDLKDFCLNHTTDILKIIKQENKNLIHPVTMQFTYTIIVDADAVPAGETIRAWLPFPRADNHRQQNIKLLSANVDNPVIAPEQYKQRSIYMEKIAKEGTPTTFEIVVSYRSWAEYHDMTQVEIGDYDKTNNFYQHFTSEKPPHIVFSDTIKTITDKLVKDISSPFEKVKTIYEYIDNRIPWASALEYSTFWNIPEYVLTNNHGDCGMQSLLLITMLRYAGIPAKWQSGWMMHPGNINLHDWAEVFYPTIGWVPVDQSFERQNTEKTAVKNFYISGIDAYRLIVNDDISAEFYPQKIFPRSETIDFQRGEVEWRGGNLYFDQWDYNMTVNYIKE